MSRRVSPVDRTYIESHACSVEKRLAILSALPFFTDLAPQAMETINRQFVERGYEPGSIVYQEGVPAANLFVVADGVVKLMRHTLGGKDVMLDILKDGDFFGGLGTSDDAGYPESAYAHTHACVLTIATDAFRRILGEHPTVALRVLDITSQRLDEARRKLGVLSAATAEQRLSYVLLKLADELGEQHEVGLLLQTPISRADLAEMTGTTPETVSRILSRFQDDGLIHTGRQWIAIADRDQMAELSEI